MSGEPLQDVIVNVIAGIDPNVARKILLELPVGVLPRKVEGGGQTKYQEVY